MDAYDGAGHRGWEYVCRQEQPAKELADVNPAGLASRWSASRIWLGEPGSLVGALSVRGRSRRGERGRSLSVRPSLLVGAPAGLWRGFLSPVGIGLAVFAFAVGAVVSLGTSWVLVTRLERVGERFGFSEALLGMLAALAADTPEITAAVTALVHHQRAVGAGVVIGSNVFNLAALLGLGAVVAGRIDLHRKVVLLGGAVGMWMATVCLVSVGKLVDPAVGLGLVLAVLVGYVIRPGSTRLDSSPTAITTAMG